MISYEAPQVVVRHPVLHRTWILVPGGWTMRVPEVTSREAAPALCQKLFESAYIKGLRDAIGRRARDYAKLWPTLARTTALPNTTRRFVTLSGFRPENLQDTYIPFRNAGPTTHEQFCEVLREMGREELQKYEQHEQQH